MAIFTLLGSALKLMALVAVFADAGTGGIVAFALLFGVGGGALAYRHREAYVRRLAAVGLRGYPAFLVTVIWVSVFEEVLCASFGCTLAYPVLWVDLVFVVGIWCVWLSSWYFVMARSFAFTYDEALLLCAVTGVLFEIVTKPATLANPLLALLAAGPVIIVYAAICALPVAFIDFRGPRAGRSKWVVGFVVPYLAVLPAAFVIFAVLMSLGVPIPP